MLAWGIVLIQNVNIYSSGNQKLEGAIFTPFLGILFCGVTIFVLGILTIFPLAFRYYAVLCCLWGLENLIDGGSTLGLLMFMLGIAFAFHSGFFKKNHEIKIIFISLAPLLALISHARFGIDTVVVSLINILAVALMFGLTFLLFLPTIRRLMRKTVENTNIVYLPAEHFSERDIRCLKKVQDGEKYESIAKDEDIGLSTLKNKMKTIYKSLNVYDKTSFMATYAGYTILLKPSSHAPVDALNKTDNNEKE
jgi:DNA-binding CsgD family transcriptional regulator